MLNDSRGAFEHPPVSVPLLIQANEGVIEMLDEAPPKSCLLKKSARFLLVANQRTLRAHSKEQRQQAFRDIRLIDEQLRRNERNWIPPGMLRRPDPLVPPDVQKRWDERQKDGFFQTQRLLRQLRREAFKRVRS
jgi:hypothetical protein